ncbi:MAG: TIGR04086 family membrane protein [Clostridia bacterium]|nr:TIGR04086 family membrane protein [Clostridia bacterium]
MNTSLPLGAGKKQASLLSCVAGGLLLSLLLLLLLSLVFTLFAYQQADPTAWVRPLSYACALLASLLGGWCAAGRRGRQGLLCGLFTGIGLLALLLCGHLITIGDGASPLGHLALSAVLVVAVAMLGGVFGTARARGGARKHHRPTRH